MFFSNDKTSKPKLVSQTQESSNTNNVKGEDSNTYNSWEYIRDHQRQIAVFVDLSNRYSEGLGYKNNIDRFLNDGKTAFSFSTETYVIKNERNKYIINVSPLIYLYSYSDIYWIYGLGANIYDISFKNDHNVGLGYSLFIGIGKIGNKWRNWKIYNKIKDKFPNLTFQITFGYRFIPDASYNTVKPGLEIKFSSGYLSRKYSKRNRVLPE